jgi:DNA-binding beta-propeller fold protein YncE
MMSNRRLVTLRISLVLLLVVSLVVTSTRLQAQTGCSPSLGLPFTDLGNLPSGFCQAVAEAYFSGLTSGTTATTYSPDDLVTRAQMAAFITRTMDQSLRRGSRRTALNQWATPGSIAAFELSATPTGSLPRMAASDGTDIWVASRNGDHVIRVRASDGQLLGTYGTPDYVYGVLIAMGRVFVTREICNGADLIMIDPKSGADTTVVSNLGNGAKGLAFDGTKIWTANDGRIGETLCVAGGSAGSVSMVTPGNTTPWSVTTLTTGFNRPFGMLYDGSHIWVTDRGDDRLKKLSTVDGSVLQSIPVGTDPGHPVFDGTNIWVPNYGSDDLTVVRVKDASGRPLASAFVLKTLTAGFMLGPLTAAFDGERVLVTCNTDNGSNGIFLFKAADLSYITGTSPGPGTKPFGACSDGLNFFVTLNGTNEMVRF